MKTNEYLYGKDIEVPEIPRDIIIRRLELLNDNLEEILKVHYHARDTVRQRDIQSAINFWEKM